MLANEIRVKLPKFRTVYLRAMAFRRHPFRRHSFGRPSLRRPVYLVKLVDLVQIQVFQYLCRHCRYGRQDTGNATETRSFACRTSGTNRHAKTSVTR